MSNEKDNGKVKHGQLTPDDNDAMQGNNNNMQFDPSLVTEQLLF